MNTLIIGGAGFIGINLAIELSKNTCDNITIIDKEDFFFLTLNNLNLERVSCITAPFDMFADFDEQVKGQDVVYHFASSVIPGNSNKDISAELDANVNVTVKLLDACVRQNVKKVVFLSSGGAVYGKKGICPVEENMVTYPITSYGIQKVAIEKLLYLYRYQKGLDYRVIRLANPYGPYQRPNGQLGVVSTFVYNALKREPLIVYGDGTVVRDFIYIDDAIKGIRNIVDGENEFRVFNLGSGRGISINEVIKTIQNVLCNKLEISYIEGRTVDVHENYLNIKRYEECYGNLEMISLSEGIMKTAKFMRKFYQLDEPANEQKRV